METRTLKRNGHRGGGSTRAADDQGGGPSGPRGAEGQGTSPHAPSGVCGPGGLMKVACRVPWVPDPARCLPVCVALVQPGTDMGYPRVGEEGEQARAWKQPVGSSIG